LTRNRSCCMVMCHVASPCSSWIWCKTPEKRLVCYSPIPRIGKLLGKNLISIILVSGRFPSLPLSTFCTQYESLSRCDGRFCFHIGEIAGANERRARSRFVSCPRQAACGGGGTAGTNNVVQRSIRRSVIRAECYYRDLARSQGWNCVQ
jgi:hypothetical protein